MKKILVVTSFLLLTVNLLLAQSVQVGEWVKDEFTTEFATKTWTFSTDFSSVVTEAGQYSLVFTYKSGANKLVLRDAVIKVDGVSMGLFPDKMSAGSNPKKIVYMFTLKKAPKKITVTASACTDGGTNSVGVIELVHGAVNSLPNNVIIDSVLYIAEGTTEIKKKAYYEKTNFNKVVIPSTVKQISGLAFHSCTNLKEVDIPASVDTIGDAAFQNDSLLTKVTLHEGISYLGYRVFKNTGITELTIPSSVDSIGKETFNGCFNLQTVVIPDGVQKINNSAFDKSALTSIEIPASVTKFGSNITSKNAVWVVEKRSPAYYYALNKGFTVETPPETLEESAAAILAESKQAQIASSEKWETGDFTTENTRRYWDFSSYIDGAGEYAITFTYTGGACKLCLADALVLVDGKAVAYFEETRSAGSNPRKIEYTVVIHSETKDLKLYALARTSGGTESKGTITLKKLLGESLNLISADTIYNGQYQYLTILKELTLGGFVKSIGENAFPSSLETLRNYNNAYVDEWATSHGWYLSNVTEDYREYTKDKNKELKRESYMTEGDEYWSEQRYRFDDSEFIPQYTERDTIDRLYGYKAKYYYTNNEEKHDYERWAAVHNSYLAKTEDNLLMLINVGDSILVEYYTPQYEKTEVKHISLELPMFGTFLASEDGYYYVVEGQYNPDEIEDLEVVRVIKYDKNWNHIKALSIYGSNTTCPFAFSQATMLENDNHLYIRTGHTMYRDSEGISHQANMFIDVDKNDMSLVYKQTGLGSSYVQYVSHSLDQLQTTKNGFYAGLDLGDAFPRAVVIGKNKQPMNNMEPGSFYTTKIINNMPQYPRIGSDSYLGVCVGGFASSETHFLTAYAMDDTAWSELIRYPSRNIYITATPDLPDGFGEHIHRKVTDYPVETYSARNPYLVKYGKNDFLLLWSRHNKVYYTHVNGDGSFGEQYSFEGHLSSCTPILYNGYIIWYVTDGNSMFFNQIDLQDISKHETIETEGNGYKYLKEIVLIGMPETDFRPYGTAFEDFYPRVESVIIDGSVKNINKGAFLGSSTLTNLVLEDGVESIMYAAFYDCDIRELDIPCSVTSIARDAFNFNKNLTKVTFCDGLQSLGIEAFRNCDLREVTIPKNVFWVDIEAFMNNPNLSKVVIEDGVQRLYDKCFAECAENLEIYVPSSVTIFGENITDPTATWVVEKGSAAYKYAIKNNYKIRLVSGDNNNNTAITESNMNNLNIYANNHTIFVENADDEILVYDAIGRLICRDAACHVLTEKKKKKSGVYVVKVGNLAKKVIVE